MKMRRFGASRGSLRSCMACRERAGMMRDILQKQNGDLYEDREALLPLAVVIPNRDRAIGESQQRPGGCSLQLILILVLGMSGLYLIAQGAAVPRMCASPPCHESYGNIIPDMVASAAMQTRQQQPDRPHKKEPQALSSVRPGENSVLGPPSISAERIDQILAEWRSPAAGTGRIWYDLGVQYGIDPAYALAFFVHESGAGTAPGWAGRKPDGRTTHNIGNIICAGYTTCYGRFRDYPTWAEGIEDWYRLIAVEYVEWRGVSTVEQIVPIYAPAAENNVAGYIATVNMLVAQWRALP